MCPNHPEHNHKHNEDCPLLKIDLPKDRVKQISIEQSKKMIYNDKLLIEIVPTLIEVVNEAEEERQLKRINSIRTKEGINKELRARELPLEITSDYKGSRKNADFLCLVPGCNHRWTEKATYVIHGKRFGCEKCNKRLKPSIKRSKEQINEELKNKGKLIIMLGDYKGMLSYTKFQCLKSGCGHKWTATPDGVCKAAFGCPECRKIILSEKVLGISRIHLSHRSKEQINQELIDINRNIEMIGEYYGMETPTKFRCLKENCKKEWTTTPSRIIYQERGCSGINCKKSKKLTEEEVFRRLSLKKIKTKSKYSGFDKLMNFECGVCSEVWTTNAGSVLRKNKSTGCPNCSNCKRVTNEMSDERTKNMPVKRMADIVNIKTPIPWLCTNPNCGNIWPSAPSTIWFGSWCEYCSKGKREKYVRQLIMGNFILGKISKKRYFINNHRRYPDFTIEREGKENIVVEYNGQQHYRPVRFGGISLKRAEKKYKAQVARDKDVDDYFKSLNIPIIWIKYDMTDEEIIEAIKKVY